LPRVFKKIHTFVSEILKSSFDSVSFVLAYDLQPVMGEIEFPGSRLLRRRGLEMQSNTIARLAVNAMKSAVAAAMAVYVMTAPARATVTDYIVNGSFETGTYSGWTSTGGGSFVGIYSSGDGFSAEAGQYFSLEGAIGSDLAVSDVQ
jgi:hypothetical protein